MEDETKKSVYLKFMTLPMARNPIDASGKALVGENGKEIHGIEYWVPSSQYGGIDGTGNPEHLKKVVEDIADGWMVRSQAGKFHAILATTSIAEAISYYRMLSD